MAELLRICNHFHQFVNNTVVNKFVDNTESIELFVIFGEVESTWHLYLLGSRLRGNDKPWAITKAIQKEKTRANALVPIQQKHIKPFLLLPAIHDRIILPHR